MIQDFYALSRISHLVYAGSKLKNAYFIEVLEFPTVIDCAPDESFMRDAFHFAYCDPVMRVDKCAHPCYGTDCGHRSGCCQRMEEIEMVLFCNSLLCFDSFLNHRWT